MFGYKRMVIARHERGLLFRNRSLEAVLGPGLYRRFDPLGRIQLEVRSLEEIDWPHPQANLLVRTAPDSCKSHFQLVEISAQEVGLLYVDDLLQGLIPPATQKVFWTAPRPPRIERLNIGEQLRIPAALAQELRRLTARTQLPGLLLQEIPNRHQGLLFIDGKRAESLDPGFHAFWNFQHHLHIELVDLRDQSMEITGQELLTKDRVSLRLNLTAGFRVEDPVVLYDTLGSWRTELYRQLQFGLRQAVGTRTLDDLLEEKESLGRAIFDQVAPKVAPYGIGLKETGVKDIILPGEMKTILNRVVEAEKQAQANLIKRREETAATRSLLNTAKLMEQNPLLRRLKELESLERITERIDKITVFGGLEGVLQDLLPLGNQKAKQGD